MTNTSQPTNLPVLKNNPRVLVVENITNWRNTHSHNLKNWNYEVIMAEGIGNGLIEDAIQKAQKYQCHLAIVDLHLYDDNDKDDKSGLDLIPNLKPAKSIIVTTGPTIGLDMESLHEIGVVGYFDKTSSRTELRNCLDKNAIKLCSCRRTDLDFSNGFPSALIFSSWFEEDQEIPVDEARDVIVQLFPDATKLQFSIFRNDTSNLTTVPRPRSVILEVCVNDDEPVIVKIGRQKRIENEVNNYDKYIIGKLVGSYYPRKINSKILWNLGGVAYQYIGKSEDTHVFSDLYKVGNLEKINNCLKDFFNNTWKNHYISDLGNLDKKRLFDVYCEVWGYKWYEHLKVFDNDGVIENHLSYFKNGKIFFNENPVKWLVNKVNTNQAGVFPKGKIAITHGDFHGDNILIDFEHKVTWVIDYERTGPGHILQDYIELESDILNRLNIFSSNDYFQFYQLCIFVTQFNNPIKFSKIQTDDAQVDFSMGIIINLRKLAYKQLNYDFTREYLWGLFFNAMFRVYLILNKAIVSDELYRTLMLASIICAKIDSYDRSEALRNTVWPPESWPRITWENRKSTKTVVPTLKINELKLLLLKLPQFHSKDYFSSIFRQDELAMYLVQIDNLKSEYDRFTWIVDKFVMAKYGEYSTLLIFLDATLKTSNPNLPTTKELIKMIQRIKNSGIEMV